MSVGRIRPAQNEDLPRLVEIINHYIETTPITFDIAPYTPETRRPWFDQFDDSGIHRILVSEVAGRVEGYATSTAHRPKAAYGRSIETTIYLDHASVGRGLGKALYGSLLDSLREHPLVHRAFAGVTLPNPASIALHESLGFQALGTFHEIGYKFDEYWDVQWFECDLSGGAP